MRVDSAPSELLTGMAGWHPVVSSWLGPLNLAASVPVLGGRVTATVTQEVPERLTLRVPRWDGRDWFPGGDPVHPLARFGQELTVSIMVWSSVTGAEYETRIGRYLITNTRLSDRAGEVEVTALGMLRRVETDLLPAPTAPRPGGTLVSEFRRLLPAGMSAGFHPDLVDRACPRSMEWPEDRLGALYEIARAWPARLRTDAWGHVQLLPPLPDVPAPVLTLTDGERGTVVAVDRDDSQDGAYNRVVATSSAQGRESVRAVYDQQTGPMRVGRGGSYPTVTRKWSSPLLTSNEQAYRSARTMVQRSLLPSRTIPVTCTPDTRPDLDTPVEVIRDSGTPHRRRDWGYVIGYDLPLTVDDMGDGMRLDVGVAA